MLRLFLAGRAARLAADDGLSAKTARLRLSWRLRREAGLAAPALAAAMSGTLLEASARTRLWAVLGHFPADHGAMLTDDGGQECMDRASPAKGPNRVGAKASAAKPATAGRASPAKGRNSVGANEEDSAHG